MIVPTPNVNRNRTAMIGTAYRMRHVTGTLKTSIITSTTPNDTIILKPFTNIFDRSSMYLGM